MEVVQPDAGQPRGRGFMEEVGEPLRVTAAAGFIDEHQTAR
jgi:hypothetical protein